MTDRLDRRSLLTAGGVVALAVAGSATAAAAAGPTNAQVLKAYTDALSARDIDKVMSMFHPTAYINHQALVTNAVQTTSAASVRPYFAKRFEAFPDLNCRAEVTVDQNDLMAFNLIWSGTHSAEYLGVPASGKKVVFNSTDIVRIKDGVMVEHWGAVDIFGLIKQMQG